MASEEVLAAAEALLVELAVLFELRLIWLVVLYEPLEAVSAEPLVEAAVVAQESHSEVAEEVAAD